MDELLYMAKDIVASYAGSGIANPDDLPGMIEPLYRALKDATAEKEEAAEVALVPAVDPNESVFSDCIISLEDGKPRKVMTRHIGLLGMTPDQYRAKWGLRADYPMVCEEYAEKRSEIAKTLGLGKLRRHAAE